MPAVQVILGVVLLFFGRSLYWAFVAVAGFLVGVQLADVTLADQTQVVRVLAAVSAGVVGALLAILVKRAGFALGELFAGGYLALSLAGAAGYVNHHLLWFGIGGLMGAVLTAVLMDWAIIVLSSLVGAAAIAAALGLLPAVSMILLFVLAAVGIAVQGKRQQPPADVDGTSS